MTIGDIIKQYRELHKMSMDEFSKKSGLSKGYISMLENKINPRNNKAIVPTLTTLQKIAQCTNIDIDDLLSSLDKNQEILISLNTNMQLQQDEKILLSSYRLLNDVGKREATKRVEELTYISKYQADSSTDHLTVQAAHARTDIEHTPEGKAHDDAIMDDDSEWE